MEYSVYDIVSYLMERLRENYKQRLKRKTGWGKNEVYIEFEQAFTDAIVQTALNFKINLES